MFGGTCTMSGRLRDDLLIETNQNPLSTMSVHYTKSTADALSKRESRYRVAHSIKKSKGEKVIHYLGGVNPETTFEDYFSKDETTFFRYEKNECPVPNNYAKLRDIPAGTNIEDKFGFFFNSDFFNVSDFTMRIGKDMKHFAWLDFCGMPTESLVNNIQEYVTKHQNRIEEIYLTFFINSRGVEYVDGLLNKYGKGNENKAQSLCDSLNDKFSLPYTFSVLDAYVNGNSPMAVIKMKKNKMKKTKTKPAVNRAVINSTNYQIMRDHGFENMEISTMWQVPTQAVAAFQAWNTMRAEKVTSI